MNKNFVQIKGPFKKGVIILRFTKPVQKLGIEIDNPDITHDFSILNGEDHTLKVFSMSKTGTIEFSNIFIETLSFNQDEPETTMINYILID